MPKTRKVKGRKLYMIRHGISCANLARARGEYLAADLYTDPELTQEGRRRARILRKYIQRHIRKPFVTGASILMRTQQTANLLLNPKKIYVVPYINEIQPGAQESVALAPDLQAEILKTTDGNQLLHKLDYSYLSNAPPVPEHEQVSAFLHWLGQNMPSKSLALVSHYGFIKELIKATVGLEVENIANCELVEFDVTIKAGRAILKNVRGIDYMPAKYRDWDAADVAKGNRCRLQTRRRRT
jgi:broad specificity phosphatase PhoE